MEFCDYFSVMQYMVNRMSDDGFEGQNEYLSNDAAAIRAAITHAHYIR